jgi:hypothetical protein
MCAIQQGLFTKNMYFLYYLFYKYKNSLKFIWRIFYIYISPTKQTFITINFISFYSKIFFLIPKQQQNTIQKLTVRNKIEITFS